MKQDRKKALLLICLASFLTEEKTRASLWPCEYCADSLEFLRVVSRNHILAPHVPCGPWRGRLRSRTGRRRLWRFFPSGFSPVFLSAPRVSLWLCEYCADSPEFFRGVSRNHVLAPHAPCGPWRGRLSTKLKIWEIWEVPIFSVF